VVPSDDLESRVDHLRKDSMMPRRIRKATPRRIPYPISGMNITDEDAEMVKAQNRKTRRMK
jgi:hypothetical protein